MLIFRLSMLLFNIINIISYFVINNIEFLNQILNFHFSFFVFIIKSLSWHFTIYISYKPYATITNIFILQCSIPIINKNIINIYYNVSIGTFERNIKVIECFVFFLFAIFIDIANIFIALYAPSFLKLIFYRNIKPNPFIILSGFYINNIRPF